MRRAIVHQGAFAAGEIDPRAVNRVDTQQYALGAKRLKNLVITPQGNVRRRNKEVYHDDQIFDFDLNSATAVVQDLNVFAPPVGTVLNHPMINHTETIASTHRFFRSSNAILRIPSIFADPNRDPDDYGRFITDDADRPISLRGQRVSVAGDDNYWTDRQYKAADGSIVTGSAISSDYINLNIPNYTAFLKWVRSSPDGALTVDFDGPLETEAASGNMHKKVQGSVFYSGISDMSLYVLWQGGMYEFWFSAAELIYDHGGDSTQAAWATRANHFTLKWNNLRDHEKPSNDFPIGFEHAIAVGKRGLSADEVFPVNGKKPSLLIRAVAGQFVRDLELTNLPVRQAGELVLDLNAAFDRQFESAQTASLIVYMKPFPTTENGVNANQWTIKMPLGANAMRLAGNERINQAEITHIPLGLTRRDDEGIAVLPFGPSAIKPFHVENDLPKWGGCYIPYGEVIADRSAFRWVATRNGWIITHPKITPFALLRLAEGIYAKNELDTELLGIPDDFKPSAVGLYHGRLYFAGTDEFPQGIWASRTGNITDFDWKESDPDQPGSPFFFNLEGSGRIHSIVTGTHLSFLSESEHWFRTSQEPPTPTNFGVQRGVQRGADKRCAPADVNGNLAYINTGLGEAVQSIFQDEVKGFLPQPLSLPASHLFRANAEPTQPAIAFDATEENYFLLVAPGNGRLALASIVPGAQMGFSEIEIYDHHFGPQQLDAEESRSAVVLGAAIGDGHIWAVTKGGPTIPDGDTIRLCRIKLTETNGEIDNEDLPWEFETLPVLLPNNEGSGVDGGSFTTYRRIVAASVDMDIDAERNPETPVRLNGRDWRRAVASGLQRWQGLRGWSRRATLRMEGTAPVEIKGVSLEALF